MARFGYLYLNNGIWDDKRVLSEAWIRKSTEMNHNNYGYLWWLRQEDGLSAFSAIGDGGNMICCIPNMNMIVAISSHFIMNPRDRWPLIKEYIIPAVL